MRVLAVIPARGGSKGIPRKNVAMLAGKPLLAWSIEAARPPTCTVGRVVVSTDSDEIAAVARHYGAEVIERPAELATDEALTDPVILHVLRRLEYEDAYHPDLVVLLQPTVPVREAGLIDRCVERMMATKADSLFTGYPLHFVWKERPVQSWSPDAAGQYEWVTCGPPRVRRQDMPAHGRLFHEDGSVYVTQTDFLQRTGSRVGGKVELLETPRTVDIDTSEDFAIAEAMLAYRGVSVESPWVDSLLRARV